jgi:hypothetical protein
LASVIAFIATVIGFVSLNQSGGYSVILVVLFLPALLILLLVDWLVKTFTKGKLLYIWIIEIILIAIGLICFPEFRMGVC